MADWLQAALARQRPLRLLRVQGSAGAYLASRLRDAHAGPMLVISPTSKRAERMEADLRAFSAGPDGGEIAVLPRYDVPPFDRFSPHPAIEARRMSLLYRLLE